MTDDITPTTQPNTGKKDEKKSTSNPPGNRGGPKRNSSNSRNTPGVGTTAQPRPSSRTSNKKSPSNPTAGPPESGSDSTVKKGSEAKKIEQRKNQVGSGPARSGSHRKAQSSTAQGGRQGNSNPKESNNQTTPTPVSGAEASDALSSLQRVIADLKTTSTPNQTSLLPNSIPASISAPQINTSNLAPNAPVFQPAASVQSGPNAADQKHRKSTSLGASALSGNFSSFSPGLGAMLEDAEDGAGNGSFEEGEIQDSYYHQQGHQPRSQSQSFVAPRFAALAAQQDHTDSMGPSGRPQLAPNFMFGARRRGNSNVPVGPPINEEDMGFQFPQQQQQQQQQTFQPDAPPHEHVHRKTDSGEITGIMAEQVAGFPPLSRGMLSRIL
jgi:protein SSD1